MANKPVTKKTEFEDISSTSYVNKNHDINKFAENGIKKIDKIIKLIAFILAIIILVVFLALAAVVLFMDSSLYLISVLVLAAGALLALITLFLVYGLGHIITQNNEILKRL